MQSICLISDDTALLLRLIDWCNEAPSISDNTKLYCQCGDVVAKIERLQMELDEIREDHRRVTEEKEAASIARYKAEARVKDLLSIERVAEKTIEQLRGKLAVAQRSAYAGWVAATGYPIAEWVYEYDEHKWLKEYAAKAGGE